MAKIVSKRGQKEKEGEVNTTSDMDWPFGPTPRSTPPAEEDNEEVIRKTSDGVVDITHIQLEND